MAHLTGNSLDFLYENYITSVADTFDPHLHMKRPPNQPALHSSSGTHATPPLLDVTGNDFREIHPINVADTFDPHLRTRD